MTSTIKTLTITKCCFNERLCRQLLKQFYEHTRRHKIKILYSDLFFNLCFVIQFVLPSFCALLFFPLSFPSLGLFLSNIQYAPSSCSVAPCVRNIVQPPVVRCRPNSWHSMHHGIHRRIGCFFAETGQNLCLPLFIICDHNGPIYFHHCLSYYLD
jgi:hypothetical protein